MEKEVEQADFTCIPFMAKRWGSSQDATVSLMMDFETTPSTRELDPADESYDKWAQAKVIGGAVLVGLAMDEPSYAMGLSDWLEHYEVVGAKKGSVCLISTQTQFEALHDYLVSPVRRMTWTVPVAASTRIVTRPVTSLLRDYLPQQLHDFCVKLNIAEYYPLAVWLIRKYFNEVQELTVQQERDPESGDEWLVLEFSIAGEVESVLKKYEQYIDHWLYLVPWPQREGIRLSYNIV